MINMIQNCEKCNKVFNSEGHVNGMWLTECWDCNVKQGRGD